MFIYGRRAIGGGSVRTKGLEPSYEKGHATSPNIFFYSLRTVSKRMDEVKVVRD